LFQSWAKVVNVRPGEGRKAKIPQNTEGFPPVDETKA